MLLSITLLLSNPNPSDPFNIEAARVLRDDPEEYTRMARTMMRRQSSGRGRQARSVFGGRNEGGVAGPDLEGEQAAEQEEEDLDEVGAGAAGGGEAGAEVNPVDGEEAAAEEIAEWVHPADEVNIEQEGEAGDEESVEEGA